MPIVDTNFKQKGGNPLEKLTAALNKLNETQPEASFNDDKGHAILNRAYLEMTISEYAQSQQNPQLFNKWLQIDTKFDKALREYKSDIQMLISGVTQMGQAQQMVAEPTGMPQPQPITPDTPQQNVDKSLPTPNV